MFAETLTLYNFRNLKDQTVNLIPAVNFIVGRNGQGKTNLIEAISLLSRSKSFRTSKAAELIKWGEKEASVFAKVFHGQDPVVLGTSFTGKTKDFYINHEKAKSFRDIVGKLVSVTFSPPDIALVKGGPQERRAFLDKNIVDIKPGYLDWLVTYQKALRHKNHILKEDAGDLRMLDPWNSIMARAAFDIFTTRKIFTGQIGARAADLYGKFSETSGGLDLRLKTNIAKDDEDVTAEKIFEKLQDSRKRESTFKSSLVGIHRDDVSISLGEKESRSFASQGESKSIVLAMKLAAIEMIEHGINDSPVVLLDDVDSELDAGRREIFLEMIFARPRQVIITGTELGVKEVGRHREHQILGAEGGQIIKSE